MKAGSYMVPGAGALGNLLTTRTTMAMDYARIIIIKKKSQELMVMVIFQQLLKLFRER